jgi:acetylornithine deacetylase/succinyl-diaminopimelate desuccinylase-like protein
MLSEYGRGMESARSMTINGHCDVVSPEPVSAWTRIHGEEKSRTVNSTEEDRWI